MVSEISLAHVHNMLDITNISRSELTGMAARRLWKLGVILVVFGTGMPQVGIFNTAPIPTYTTPIPGMGTYCTI